VGPILRKIYDSGTFQLTNCFGYMVIFDLRWPQIVDSWTILRGFQSLESRLIWTGIQNKILPSNININIGFRLAYWNHLPHKPLFSVQVIFFTCVFLTKNLKVFRFVDQTIREYPTSVSTVCSLMNAILFWGF